MKKYIIKISSLFFSVLVMLQAVSVTAFAVRPNLSVGDVNMSNGVRLNDVVLFQRYLAGLENFSKSQLYNADVNDDGDINLNDVTEIQKYLAGIVIGFKKSGINPYAYIENFYVDYMSGKAMVGVPVTFTATTRLGTAPYRFEFSINDKVVQSSEELNTLTYTFTEAGEYQIKFVLYNCFDNSERTQISSYKVVEPYTSDKPVIKSICKDRLHVFTHESGTTFTAEAFMGTAPYTYRFLLDGKPLTENFYEKNTVSIGAFKKYGGHTITVQVKDVNSGDEYVSEDYAFYVIDEYML